MRGRKPKPIDTNIALPVGSICPGYRKGEDRLCKYYTGNRKWLESCYNKCRRKAQG